MILDGHAHDLERFLSTPSRPDCRECGGEGLLKGDDPTGDGWTVHEAECPHCEGTGEEPDDR